MMSYEQYSLIFDAKKNGQTLRPQGDPFAFSFDFAPQAEKNYRLFTVGESVTYFQWKCEDARNYHEISDSLNTKEARQCRYCLDFSARLPFGYVKAAYKKLMFPPALNGWLEFPFDTITYGISVKGSDVRVNEGGFLRMRLDIRYKKEGVNPYDILPDADKVLVLDFPQGTYDYVTLKDVLPLDREVASVGVWVEGKNYTGEVYLEHPFMDCGEYNYLPDFAAPVNNAEEYNWTGQNLSRKEWPEFRVILNGTEIYKGEIFERCHRQSDWSIPIPDGVLQEHNTLSYQLLSDYHDPLPYNIFESGIIATDGGEFALVSASFAGVKGKNAHLLVRTKYDGMTLSVTTDGKTVAEPACYFEKAGLHGIRLFCPEVCKNAKFTLKSASKTVEGEIPVVLERGEDAVITGTGDAVYIAQDMDAMEEHLAWYFGEHIGDMITFRPVYRWCGTREINPAVWKEVVRILNELEVKYVVLTDGRELAGQDANPTYEMVDGEGNYGLQLHERDGQILYWGAGDGKMTDTNRQLHEMFTEIRKNNPDYCRSTPDQLVYDGNKLFVNVDPYTPRDMKKAAEHSIDRLARLRKTQSRHTGPSVLFKYLYEAGFTWLGAETMYSGMGALMAFLRGFAKAKNLPTFGVHQAVQWCSVPHDVPDKYRRFRLALYAAYLLGSHDNNTEEGLWRIEEFYSHFHRFDEPCLELTRAQQDFYRYTATHTRKGEFHTPVAFLHGRYDGRTGFGYDNVWGNFKATDAEMSWDLLKVFFPLNEVHSHLHVHYGPTDRPLGWQTGTPYGQADVLPVECASGVYKDYKVLSFAGYNCAEEKDLKGLLDYVKTGGKLLLTRAHLTHTTDRDAIEAGRLEYGAEPFGLTDGAPVFAEGKVGGETVLVCTNPAACEVMEKTDEGFPLLCRYRIGDGEVYLYNVSAYPAHPAIRETYKETLKRLTCAAVADEKVWATCGEDVEFAVYRTEDETHIYLMAMDWYNSPEGLRRATLRVGSNAYEVEMPFGTMLKVVSDGKRAAWCCDEAGEVLNVGESIRVQGTKDTSFCIAEDGRVRKIEVQFGESPIEIIE